MKVKTATLLFTTLIFGLFLVLGVSLMQMTSLLDREAKDLAMAGESIGAAKKLKNYLLIHNRNTFFYSLHQDPVRFTTTRNMQREVTDIVMSMKQLVNGEEAESTLAEIETKIASYLQKLDRLDELELSAMEQYRELSKDVDGILPVVDKLIEANQSHMDVLIATIGRQNKIADRIGIFLLTVGGIALSALMGMMFFYIVQPLRAVAETISRFSAGDTSVRVEPVSLMEIRQIGSNFNSMANRLEEKQQEQLGFIAAIAHDLRNPLNSMSMASELLNHKGEREYRDLAGIILRQVKNLDRMVGDLLDTTRIEAGHIDLKFSSNNINSLIMDSVQLHRTGSDLHRLNIELPDEPLICQCDGGRISQVMNNLLSNATKYSPNGGTVTVRAHRAGNEVVISIADEGIGIATEDLDDIFKPFNRSTATRGAIPGIGLGLSASRHIVEAHGGKLRVESVLGSGSTFYFSLPTKNKLSLAWENPSAKKEQAGQRAGIL